jgi:hypothetical protein
LHSVNIYSHSGFLRQRLREYLKDDTFAKRMWRSIGHAIHTILEERASEDDGFSALFPVEALFLWISRNGGFDPAWLQDDDGQYIDDSGQRLGKTIPYAVSGVEQLAAYGLWLIEEEMPSIGNHEDDQWGEHEFNSNGFSELEAIDHRAECMLLAYQALMYAARLTQDTALTPAEAAQVSAVDFAACGKRGADRRHANMRALKKHAIALFETREWQTPAVAANTLKAQIIDYGRSIGVNLVPDNAQRTISAWFKESIAKKKDV